MLECGRGCFVRVLHRGGAGFLVDLNRVGSPRVPRALTCRGH